MREKEAALATCSLTKLLDQVDVNNFTTKLVWTTKMETEPFFRPKGKTLITARKKTVGEKEAVLAT